MTVQNPASEFTGSLVASLAQARSYWLDSFSQLEIAVFKFELRCCGVALARGVPLKQRLPTLAANCVDAKVPAQELHKLVRDCEPLLPLRATIVHSTMKTEKRGDHLVAIFQNSFDVANGIPVVAEMKAADFASGSNNLRRIAKAFARLGSSPSAPPPPKPA